ncbi:hypothetical protein SteCoe_27696 [Stentor coeruleus]|uniref:Bromo domain-containing protein n=1 Tax=Stentor coeruleus TaxID=5963 RepID=A0A1R2B9Z1_9CILI|nr:hypothetical protein SteCoe_27696 [Stentor coeruleus]
MDNKTKNDLLTVVRALCTFPCARPFLKPVNALALDIPDYLEIVTKPMDFATIKSKLNNKQYESEDDLLNDIHLIIENCYKYNADPKSLIRILCEELKKQLERQWKMYLERKNVRLASSRPGMKLPIKRQSQTIDGTKIYENDEDSSKEKKILESDEGRDGEIKSLNGDDKNKTKVKESKKRLVEIEYQEVLNFDKLTGKSDFNGTIKFKVPDEETHEENAVENSGPCKLDSIEYIKAALLPLVDPSSRPLLKNTLLNAIFTVSCLK